MSTPRIKLPPRYVSKATISNRPDGVLLHCHDEFLKRDVAIKICHLSSGARTDIEQEMRILSEIRSPHIVEVFDKIVDPSGIYIGIVEEYVPGAHLKEHIETCSPGQITSALWQIACGIKAVHQHGKIHRDIKPENIKLDAENVIKILDFGFSMDALNAKTIRSRGTLYYAAPEYFGISPIDLTAAVDVYAFAVVAWFCISGCNVPAFLWDPRRRKNVQIPSLSTVRPDWSPELVDLLDKSLSIDVGMRPSISELEGALARQLLYGRHRAQITTNGRKYTIDQPNKGVVVKSPSGLHSMTIRYTGYRFIIADLAGDVYINNETVQPGERIPASCVITFGAPHLGADRDFATLDMSHPEVII